MSVITNIMKIIKLISIALILIALPTVIGVFINWDITLFNPSTWKADTRAFAALYYIIIIIIIISGHKQI